MDAAYPFFIGLEGLILLGPPMEQQHQVGLHSKVFETSKFAPMSFQNILHSSALNDAS